MITIQLAGDLCIYIFATYLMFYKKKLCRALREKNSRWKQYRRKIYILKYQFTISSSYILVFISTEKPCLFWAHFSFCFILFFIHISSCNSCTVNLYCRFFLGFHYFQYHLILTTKLCIHFIVDNRCAYGFIWRVDVDLWWDLQCGIVCNFFIFFLLFSLWVQVQIGVETLDTTHGHFRHFQCGMTTSPCGG